MPYTGIFTEPHPPAVTRIAEGCRTVAAMRTAGATIT